jgi:hypothetical protein
MMSDKTLIKDYLKDLSRELGDVDQALKVEALDDAEEFLDEMAGEHLGSGTAKDREQALRKAIRAYGSPRTVAREYLRRSTEEERHPTERMDGPFMGVLGVYIHKETYLGLLYLLLMFPLGTLMFSYILLGLSVGIGMAITIIGIPILVFFLISIYGISYTLGRFSELMLGIRMPRKKRKMYLVGKNWTRLKTMLKDWRLYSSLLFLFLLFPLGLVYFTVLVTLFAVSISLITVPVWLIISGSPDLSIFVGSTFAQAAIYTLAFLTGVVLFTWTLHLSNFLWYLHGKLARSMLLKV